MIRHTLILFLIFCVPGLSHANIDVVNGSFEDTETIPAEIPTATGYWGGDICEVISDSDGINPFEGAKMLKFINTTRYGPSSSSIGSQLYQFIDLRDYSAYIAMGETMIRVSFYVNRINVDSYTDTEFGIGIDAFVGDPGNYPNTNYITRTDSVSSSGVSDSELNTWELISAELTIPPNTEYICVIISATENVQNDGIDPEFDGHYCDNVTVIVDMPVATENSSWGRIKRCLTVP